MAALNNYPVALAPGMGTNSYFAFVICIGMEVPWPAALSMTFWNGIVFLLLTVTGLRERIAEAIPHGVKVGIQCGIGFFIAFIGLKSVGIVVPHDVTFVSIGNLTAPSAVLVLAGFILMVYLSMKRVAGAILLTIIALTLIGLFVPHCRWPLDEPARYLDFGSERNRGDFFHPRILISLNAFQGGFPGDCDAAHSRYV